MLHWTMRQISVLLENLSGRLAEVTRALAAQGINVRAMTIADTSESGILRIIADQTDRAVGVLQALGLPVRVTEVLGIEVPDAPGAAADVLEAFRAEDLNVEYLYASWERSNSGVAVLVKVSDLAEGARIVRSRGWGLLTGT